MNSDQSKFDINQLDNEYGEMFQGFFLIHLNFSYQLCERMKRISSDGTYGSTKNRPENSQNQQDDLGLTNTN